jgi:hypothetical protein
MSISPHQTHQNPSPPASATMRDTREPCPPRAEPPDRRESLELRELQTREDEEQLGYSSPSASSGEEYRVTTRRTSVARSTTSVRSTRKGKGVLRLSRIARFWTQHVALTVPQRSNRDHFGTFVQFHPRLLQIRYTRYDQLSVSCSVGE